MLMLMLLYFYCTSSSIFASGGYYKSTHSQKIKRKLFYVSIKEVLIHAAPGKKEGWLVVVVVDSGYSFLFM